MIKKVAIFLIRTYQKFISPYIIISCKYMPTCSQYAIDAIEQLGVEKGLAAAFWRLLRCNPCCAGGYDPVKTKN